MAPCILFSFAHPDDESFSGAGTAMKYAAAGARTVLVTATRGEQGNPGDPPLCSPEQLGAWREKELIDKYFFSQPNLDRILAVETWRQAWGPPLPRHPSQDLMEGLES